jgi:hypothetical protein
VRAAVAADHDEPAVDAPERLAPEARPMTLDPLARMIGYAAIGYGVLRLLCYLANRRDGIED